MKLCKMAMTGVATSLFAFMSGCVSRPSSFVASSKPVEYGQYQTVVLKDETTVTGTCWQMSILFFSFGRVGSSQSLALQDALSKVNRKGNVVADALISMAVDTEVFEILPFLCPVIGFYATRVTGIPVKTNDVKTNDEDLVR